MFIGGEGGGAWGLRVLTISKIQDKVRPISLHYVTGHLVAIYWAVFVFRDSWQPFATVIPALYNERKEKVILVI